jgi:histone H3/H4
VYKKLTDHIAAVKLALEHLIGFHPRLAERHKEYMALAEIRCEQQTTDLTFDRVAFAAVAKEVAATTTMQFSPLALTALQTAAEHHLTTIFTAAGDAAIHAGRDIVCPKDIRCVQKIQNPWI